jgi:2-isopropylmalate synthase
VLCDTNGGMLPQEVARSSSEVARGGRRPLGIHVHNDAGCAVANSLSRVEPARPGPGRRERLRRADRQRRPDPDRREPRAEDGRRLPARGSVERLTEVAHYVAEVANVAPDSRQPYAGRYRVHPQGGLHASGVARLSGAYEHVGARSRRATGAACGASDLGGGATLRMKAEEFGLDSRTRASRWLERAEGARGARLHVRGRRRLARAADAAGVGWTQPFFEIDSYRVHVEERVGDGEAPLAEATVKVAHEGHAAHRERRGHGPVGASTTRCARRS